MNDKSEVEQQIVKLKDRNNKIQYLKTIKEIK